MSKSNCFGFIWTAVDRNPCFRFQLDCCGFDGPKEFAYNNEPIDDSCYDDVTGANSGIVARREDQSVAKKMKQVRNHHKGVNLTSNVKQRDIARDYLVSPTKCPTLQVDTT